MSSTPGAPPAVDLTLPPANDDPGVGPAGSAAPPSRSSGAGPAPIGRPPAASLLPILFRAGVLLLIEALSLGLCLWGIRAGQRVAPYAVANTLTRTGRLFIIGDMFGAAALFLGAASAYLIATRGRGAAQLERVARRLAPLTVVGLLPFLLRWTMWNEGRDLDFLVLAAIFGLGARVAVLASLRAGPILRGRPAAAMVRVRGRLASALARSERWAPATLVGLAVLWYALFFSYYTIANHHNLRTASLDLGLEDNLVWNLVHRGSFLKTSPGFGPVGGHFGYHATFFAYVIGLVYLFAQRPETLLVLQATMIGAAAIPLFLFARRHLGAWAGAVVALVYIFYPPVHGSNLYDFHYLPLGPVLLWLTLYLVEARRDRWAALALLLTLSVREDVAAGLVIVGAYLILAGERPRAGLIVAAVAGAYFVLLKLVLMPRALHGASSFIHQYAGLLPSGENSFGAVLKTVIGNPVFTMHNLLEREKLVYALQIAVPLCFLPWLSGMGLLCSLPGFFFNLLATAYPPLIQISFQYTAHWTAYLFIALVWNLRRVGAPRAAGDAAGPERRAAWLAALVLTTLVTTNQYGGLLQRNTIRGGFGPFIFQTTEGDRVRYATLKQVIRLIPPRAKVVSSENLVPHVSQRPDSYTLRMGIFDAEYLLVMLPVRGDEAVQVQQALESNQFGVVMVKEPFLLARRGAGTTGNAAALARVR